MKPRFRAEWVVVSEELLILASCLLGHLGSPGQSAIKRVCVCVCVCVTAGVTEVWVMIGICGYARISARYEGQMSGVGANVLHSASTTGLHVAKCAESVE